MEYFCVITAINKIPKDLEAAYWPYIYIMPDKSVG
jgi:hypothetical protein